MNERERYAFAMYGGGMASIIIGLGDHYSPTKLLWTGLAVCAIAIVLHRWATKT